VESFTRKAVLSGQCAPEPSSKRCCGKASEAIALQPDAYCVVDRTRVEAPEKEEAAPCEGGFRFL